MEFSEKLQNLRKSKGWTQEQLAEAAGISRQTLSKWELGTAKPDADNIVIISKIFGVSTDYLLIADYNSDEDLPQVQLGKQMVFETYQRRIRLIIGAMITGISLAGILILAVLGSVADIQYTDMIVSGPEHVYTGLQGYLKFYHLEWLFILLLVMAIAGIVIMAWSGIVRVVRRRSA